MLDLSTLNEPQREAVLATEGPLLEKPYRALRKRFAECCDIVADIRALTEEEDDLLGDIVTLGKLSGNGFASGRRLVAPLEAVFPAEGDPSEIACEK